MSEDLAPVRLDPARAYKPLDLGNGEVAASVAPDGLLLAVGGFHQRLGYLTLEGAVAFPAGRRGDQPAVRTYRAALAEPSAPGFGLVPERPWAEVAAGLLADSIPVADLAGAAGVEARVVTWAPAGAGASVVQRWRLHNPGPAPVAWRGAFAGRLRLGRAAMTELVEGGPLPDPPPAMAAEWRDGALVVAAPGAGLAAAVAYVIDCCALPIGEATCLLTDHRLLELAGWPTGSGPSSQPTW